MHLMRSGRSSPEPRLLVDEKTGYGTSTMALNGPSRLQGNLPGRFRGGLGSEMGPAHPTPVPEAGNTSWSDRGQEDHIDAPG